MASEGLVVMLQCKILEMTSYIFQGLNPLLLFHMYTYFIGLTHYD